MIIVSLRETAVHFKKYYKCKNFRNVKKQKFYGVIQGKTYRTSC